MKNLLMIFSLTLALAGKGQNFEGIITWSVRYTPTDTTAQALVLAHIPQTFVLRVRDSDNYLSAEGALRSSAVLWVADKKKYYSLDPAARTYKTLEVGDWATAAARPSVTNTGEQQVILGYNCTRYIVTSAVDSRLLRIVYWTTTELKGLDMKSMPTPGTGGNISQSMFHEYVSGFPLKIDLYTAQLHMEIEAVSVAKKKLSVGDIAIPSDFKESK